MSEGFLEDFSAGQLFISRQRRRVTKEDIVAFAKQYDPQPFHVDEDAARKSFFRGLIASGWHTAALTMSMIATGEFRTAGGTIGLGFDNLRWPLPVRPGDELRIEMEVLEIRPSRSRPEHGVMKIRTRTFNQDGQMVQEVTSNIIVPRRPAAGGQPA